MTNKRFYLIKDGCPFNPWDIILRSGKVPYEWLEEVSEDVALLDQSKTITYGLTNEEVKSFFALSKQKLCAIPS
jgi:nitrogen-specific signal transduction histidine kinase